MTSDAPLNLKMLHVCCAIFFAVSAIPSRGKCEDLPDTAKAIAATAKGKAEADALAQVVQHQFQCDPRIPNSDKNYDLALRSDGVVKYYICIRINRPSGLWSFIYPKTMDTIMLSIDSFGTTKSTSAFTARDGL